MTAALDPVSTTAPAGSRDESSKVLPGPRIVAREFARLFADHGLPAHPAEIRRLAHNFCASRRPLSDVEDVVLSYADPTGEQARRELDRTRAAARMRATAANVSADREARRARLEGGADAC